jgi:hypothetical protein
MIIHDELKRRVHMRGPVALGVARRRHAAGRLRYALLGSYLRRNVNCDNPSRINPSVISLLIYGGGLTGLFRDKFALAPLMPLSLRPDMLMLTLGWGN